MRILHVIHDFLPTVSAGVEVYVFQLAREQARRHEVAVFHASFVAGAPNYEVRPGSHGGVRTIEVVNNRLHRRFEDSWNNARMEAIFAGAVRDFEPDAVHFHHLMNHSVGYVGIAKAAGARTVFTLHDFFAVCPSGGQLFDADAKICPGPGPSRCPHCYASSALYLGPAERVVTALRSRAFASMAKGVRKRLPRAVETAVRLAKSAVTAVHPPASWREIGVRNEAMLRAFDACDAVLSPSRFLGRSMQAFGMRKDFVHSDYGFVRPRDSRPTTHDLRLATSCTGPNAARWAEATSSVVGRRSSVVSPLRVGFIGPITRHKGVEVLLKAAEIAGGRIEVRVHGSETVDPALSARLKARYCFPSASSLPPHASRLMPHAFFNGPFPPGALDDVFRGLDVLVVPSVWPENSPLVIHEATMRGVPVIASHMGGIPELVRDGVSGFLFAPGDVEKLAHLLRRVRDGRSLLADLAKRLPEIKSIGANAVELERLYRR
ncbi:MAG: glycosyltransferase [Deltaproteobacteria bacterium]|nr:glycosyltransferase [Deltaproteobacteria bacterium]